MQEIAGLRGERSRLRIVTKAEVTRAYSRLLCDQIEDLNCSDISSEDAAGDMEAATEHDQMPFNERSTQSNDAKSDHDLDDTKDEADKIAVPSDSDDNGSADVYELMAALRLINQKLDDEDDEDEDQEEGRKHMPKLHELLGEEDGCISVSTLQFGRRMRDHMTRIMAEEFRAEFPEGCIWGDERIEQLSEQEHVVFGGVAYKRNGAVFERVPDPVL